eukprot:GHVU01034161.1.p1 GENE.GHVU01034161.1~~GHVU01034161.1.p1  ORF type:complete len:316 (-),score=48.43 GHVU01034161.1:372-1319(-)
MSSPPLAPRDRGRHLYRSCIDSVSRNEVQPPMGDHRHGRRMMHGRDQGESRRHKSLTPMRESAEAERCSQRHVITGRTLSPPPPAPGPHTDELSSEWRRMRDARAEDNRRDKRRLQSRCASLSRRLNAVLDDPSTVTKRTTEIEIATSGSRTLFRSVSPAMSLDRSYAAAGSATRSELAFTVTDVDPTFRTSHQSRLYASVGPTGGLSTAAAAAAAAAAGGGGGGGGAVGGIGRVAATTTTKTTTIATATAFPGGATTTTTSMAAVAAIFGDPHAAQRNEERRRLDDMRRSSVRQAERAIRFIDKRIEHCILKGH